jgi:hypothetical protein
MISKERRFVNRFFVVCQEQIELSGFVARELSAFLFHEGGDILEQEGSGGRALPQRMRSYPQPIPAAFAERGGRGLWVTPSGRFFYLFELSPRVIISQFPGTVKDGY